jgi:hypothetical protein
MLNTYQELEKKMLRGGTRKKRNRKREFWDPTLI